MKKKELLKGTPMKPTKKMVEMSRETMKAERWNKVSITVPKFAWFYRARKIEDTGAVSWKVHVCSSFRTAKHVQKSTERDRMQKERKKNDIRRG